jgi:hypothetical protein
MHLVSRDIEHAAADTYLAEEIVTRGGRVFARPDGTYYSNVPDRPGEDIPPRLKDVYAAGTIAHQSQTILVAAETALQLVNAAKTIGLDVEVRLPFPDICIQFSRPIDEGEVMAFEEPYTGDGTRYIGKDQVAALLLAEDHDPAVNDRQITVIAWFTSKTVNRVAWHAGTRKLKGSDDANKQRLQRLGLAIIAFLNAENVDLERHEADRRVNEKRVRKGKRPLPEYYTCTIRKTHNGTEYRPDAPTGRHVSHCFAVRGHFRRIRDGRRIWVTSHLRGLAYADQPAPKKVYQLPDREIERYHNGGITHA